MVCEYRIYYDIYNVSNVVCYCELLIKNHCPPSCKDHKSQTPLWLFVCSLAFVRNWWVVQLSPVCSNTQFLHRIFFAFVFFLLLSKFWKMLLFGLMQIFSTMRSLYWRYSYIFVGLRTSSRAALRSLDSFFFQDCMHILKNKAMMQQS